MTRVSSSTSSTPPHTSPTTTHPAAPPPGEFYSDDDSYSRSFNSASSHDEELPPYPSSPRHVSKVPAVPTAVRGRVMPLPPPPGTYPGSSGPVPVRAPKVVPEAMTKHLPCPLVMTDGGEQMGLTAMDVMAECHMATAVVNIRTTFVNNTGAIASGMLLVPTHPNATMSAAQVRIGDRVLETIVIPNEEAAAIQAEQDALRAATDGAERPGEAGGAPGSNPYAQAAGGGAPQSPQSPQPANWLSPERLRANPFVFMLPFAVVGVGEKVETLVTYYEDLAVERGSFVLRVPTVIPDALLPPGTATVESVFSARVEINAGSSSSAWGSASHMMSVEDEDEAHITLVLDKASGPVPNRDFEVSYSVWNDEILTSLLVEDAASDAYDQRSAFTLFVTPPAQDKLSGTFRRNIVFVLDRSGSMGGRPMQHTIEAANVGLTGLTPDDYFSIIAFDDQMITFSPEVVAATEANVAAAGSWLAGVDARGLTDIGTPVAEARRMLTGVFGVPFVFLVTDGAVADEQQICKAAMRDESPIRIFTLGIGPYCNAYFLKLLATIGRGYAERVFHSSEIEPKMTKLLNIASIPVLRDVAVGLDVPDCELYPFPIPDLFVGAPLVVSGKFSGAFPSTLFVQGEFPSGARTSIPVTPSRSSYVPVSRIFVKQRLDLLTAQAWLDNDQAAVDEIVRLSVSENMPCEHTCLVLYEPDPAEAEADAAQREERRAGGGGAAGPSSRKKSKTSKGAVLAACALGGVAGIVILGATAPSFGSVAATMANASVADAMTSAVAAFGDAFASIGDLAQGAAGGDCCGDCCSGCDSCGSCLASVGDVFSSCCSAISSCLSSACETIGNCDACSELGDCAGGGDCAGC